MILLGFQLTPPLGPTNRISSYLSYLTNLSLSLYTRINPISSTGYGLKCTFASRPISHKSCFDIPLEISPPYLSFPRVRWGTKSSNSKLRVTSSGESETACRLSAYIQNRFPGICRFPITTRKGLTLLHTSRTRSSQAKSCESPPFVFKVR